MKGVQITRTVKINLNANDWDLYTSIWGADKVAKDLNETLELAVNAGDEKDEVRRRVLRMMDIWADYGTVDGEPAYVLERILNDVFGKDKKEEFDW